MGTITWSIRRLVRARDGAAEPTRSRSEDLRQGPLVLGIFIAAQALDGLLTYWGVSRFGIDLEMNSLLASTMHEFGPATTLLMAKGLACGCGVLLYMHSYLRPLAAVSGLCLGLAVLPWLFVWASA